MVMLVCIFESIGMVFTIGMLMETHCPAHRDIQQANQLARFSLTAGAGDEVSRSISPVLMATVRQRFRSRFPPPSLPAAYPLNSA
jgi:hypothetical protein